jgi:thiamine biosynthesis lipoprotein ApbE
MNEAPVSASWLALGTTAVVAVSDPPALEAARAATERVISAFDRACSRFRADSEIVAVGRGGGGPVRISSLLAEAVAAALRAAALTDGDVDPTLGGALCALGYDRDFAELGARGPARVRAARIPGWQVVRLDREASTLALPPGLTLDLGATAKALCADHCAAAAAAASGAGVLVSLGGDLAIAGPVPADGWRVRVTDDHRAGVQAPGQWITLREGGLATSSTEVRRWETEAGPAHHLLDPGTGAPVRSRWRTVSVCAASCLDANVASTAAIIRGERALPWLEELGLPSRLVARDGSVRHLAGWPPGGDDLAPAHAAPAAAGSIR